MKHAYRGFRGSLTLCAVLGLMGPSLVVRAQEADPVVTPILEADPAPVAEAVAKSPKKKKKAKKPKKSKRNTGVASVEIPPSEPAAPDEPALKDATPQEIQKICAVMERKKRASYAKFESGKERFETERKLYMKKLEKDLNAALARPQRLFTKAIATLSEGTDTSKNQVSELVEIIRAYAHPEWFEGENSSSYREFGEFIVEEIAIIEKQVRKNIDSKYFIDSDARLKEQGVPYLRGETVDVRFYPAAKSIGVSACAMDINDLLKAYLKGDTKPLETSFWWKGFSQHQEFRPLCIRVDLPVLDFDPTKVDLKSEFKKRLESAISEVSAWTPPPAYYDSLEKYLDHVLPKVCRPKSVESTEVSITPEPVETQAAGETPVDEATPNQGEQPTQDSSETGETSDNSSGDDVDL